MVILNAARDTPTARRAARVGAELGAEVIHAARLTGLKAATERETYRNAKSTLAVTMAPASALRLQPIPPSADFRLDLATGCPAHCQYCYLAGSLTGPPGHAGLRQPGRHLRGRDGPSRAGHDHVAVRCPRA